MACHPARHQVLLQLDQGKSEGRPDQVVLVHAGHWLICLLSYAIKSPCLPGLGCPLPPPSFKDLSAANPLVTVQTLTLTC